MRGKRGLEVTRLLLGRPLGDHERATLEINNSKHRDRRREPHPHRRPEKKA
jgi:hypothetical protein